MTASDMGSAQHIQFKRQVLNYTNFAGKPNMVDKVQREFMLPLDDDEAEICTRAGLVTHIGRFSKHMLKVRIGPTFTEHTRFRVSKYPIVVDFKGELFQIHEGNIHELDVPHDSGILRGDITINPHHWKVGGNTGISAYLVHAELVYMEPPF